MPRAAPAAPRMGWAGLGTRWQLPALGILTPALRALRLAGPAQEAGRGCGCQGRGSRGKEPWGVGGTRGRGRGSGKSARVQAQTPHHTRQHEHPQTGWVEP